MTLFRSKIEFDSLSKKLCFLILAISLIGVMILYSADQTHSYAKKHLFHISISMLICVFIVFLNPRVIYNFSYLPYILAIILLIAIEIFGITAKGGNRWISILGIRFQPSELTKVGFVLALAKYLSTVNQDKAFSLKVIFTSCVIAFLPAVLIIKQPDLGTGMILIFVFVTMLFAFGCSIWLFIVGFISVLISAPIIWSMLHGYQRKRVEIFINPDSDPLGSGYNIIQSKIALGSGGFLGKGFGMGTQSHLDFLPEHHTDFIFACFAEEFGFLGCLIMLVLYFSIILINIYIIYFVKNTFHKMVIVGVNSIFFFHIFVNIAMVSGLTPVVGVPLPFISSGGAIFVSMVIGFSIVLNFYGNKRFYK